MDFKELLPVYNYDDEKRFFDDMSGWVKFQPILAEIEDPTECLKRLAYEIKYYQRKMIMERIVQKYNKIKAKEMERAFYEYYNSKCRPTYSTREDS